MDIDRSQVIRQRSFVLSLQPAKLKQTSVIQCSLLGYQELELNSKLLPLEIKGVKTAKLFFDFFLSKLF